MSVTSNRTVTISWAGTIDYSQAFEASTVSTGSGQNQLVTLASGNNAITVPTNAIAVTILMPVTNTVQVTLKGVNGDTGIALNLLDPTSIGLQAVSAFVLSAASAVTVRLMYS